MRYFDEILKRSVDTIKKYDMISDDKGIMVGLSGGKDSLLLLQVLHAFLKRSKYKYPLAAGHVDMGLGADITPLKDFCKSLSIPLFIEKSDIGPVVFDIRKEKNPCSLCSKMRRGAFNDLAKKSGFDKVALGHHMDDFIETFLLNMFYEGRIGTFSPKTYLNRRDITVIRPLLSVPEGLITRYSKSADLPVVKNPCAADGHTRRDDMQNILKQLELINPACRDIAYKAIERLELGEDRRKWKD